MNAQALKICLVEDDVIMGESLNDRFALENLPCDWYRTAHDAIKGISRNKYALVISDIRLPDMNGEVMFGKLKGEIPHLPPFIFITGFGSIDRAVQLLKMGAADYITKPFDLDQLLEKANTIYRQSAALDLPTCGEAALGISAAMRKIESMLPRLAAHAQTILVTGESGVGKEHVARALHKAAGDEAAPFVAVNCGALTESLLEAELFGHEKGSFTGALRTRKGVFETAHNGTLFLDEIGETPPVMQVKLLRAIQERAIVRVGGDTAIPVNVRLICATNRDLKKMVEEGTFREDLYYRINVIQLKIPPLRERREDILWFAQHFLQQYGDLHPQERKTLAATAEKALLACSWPGNLRELKHAIDRACILSPNHELSAEDMLDQENSATGQTAAQPGDLNQYLHAREREHIVDALARHQWHMGQTAEELGISRKNLWEKMKKLGIQNEG